MRFLATFISFFLITTLVHGQQGISFIDNQLEEAFKEARLQDKDIFIDTYATWCKPCKKMDLVFKEEELSDSFNDKFINLKIDIETIAGKSFAKKYDVVFLPTMFIINKDGYVKHRIDGLMSSKDLIGIGDFVMKEN